MGYAARKVIKCLLCNSPSVGRKLCKSHYYKMKRLGCLHNYPVLGVDDVFDDRYIKMPNGCWEWSGTRNKDGYGIFLLPKETPVRAHRLMYERIFGKIPDGMIILHSCDNPPCVNPQHLSVGTKKDNAQDCATKRRHRYGFDNHSTKLSEDDVSEIKISNEKQPVLAKKYNVSQSQISRIKSGKRRCINKHD